MKVRELIELLKVLPQDHEVIMSKEGEGNGFSPYSDYGLFMYVPDSTGAGEIVSLADVEAGESQEYVENAVVLWPVSSGPDLNDTHAAWRGPREPRISTAEETAYLESCSEVDYKPGDAYVFIPPAPNARTK